MDKKALISPTYQVVSRNLRDLRLKNSCLGAFVAKTHRNLFTPLETCLLFLMGRNPLLINDLRLRKITYEKINFLCKTNPNSKKSSLT